MKRMVTLLLSVALLGAVGAGSASAYEQDLCGGVYRSLSTRVFSGTQIRKLGFEACGEVEEAVTGAGLPMPTSPVPLPPTGPLQI